MKLTFVLLGLSILGLSSFTKDNLEEKYSNTTHKIAFVDQTSEAEKLMAKSDCMVCHNKDKKIIGPSFVEIAKKYPANEKNVKYLVEKIIKGGSGVWGPIPMAAHVDYKKEDAKIIVKYILALK